MWPTIRRSRSREASGLCLGGDQRRVTTGLDLNASNGNISGTPTSTGSFNLRCESPIRFRNPMSRISRSSSTLRLRRRSPARAHYGRHCESALSQHTINSHWRCNAL